LNLLHQFSPASAETFNLSDSFSKR